MSSLFKIAFRNVKVNWRRSLAVLLSIACAFFSLALFQGYIDNVKGLYQSAYRHRALFGDVLIQNKDLYTKDGRLNPFKYYLDVEEQTFVDHFIQSRQKDIVARVRALEIQGVITNGLSSNPFVGAGHDLDQALQMRGATWRWDAVSGTPLELAPAADSVVLGQGLGELLGCSTDQLRKIASSNGGYVPEVRPFACPRTDVQLLGSTETGQTNALDATVVGLIDGGYKEIDKRLVHISLENAQSFMNTRKITSESVLLTEPELASDFIDAFNRAAAIGDPRLKAQTWQSHRLGEMFLKSMSLLSVFRNFLMAVIGAIAMLTVLNSTMKIVTERIREIGTLLSLGFDRSKVLIIFLIESLLLTLIGCAGGEIAVITASGVLNRMQIYIHAANMSQPTLLHIDLSFAVQGLTIALLVLLNLATVYWVCWRVLRRTIVGNLTHA